MNIVSWNIQWGRGCDGLVDLARIVRTARETADFDVLCLQEVAVGFQGLPGNLGEDQVATLRALLPGFVVLFGIAADLPDGPGGRSQFGNVLATRLPLRQVFRHLLPWPADPAVPSMQRMALEAVLESPVGPVRIVTTHLAYYSARQRMAQVAALRSLHAEACAHARDPRPGGSERGTPFDVSHRPASAVFCGDFNFEPGSPEHDALQAPFGDGASTLRDAWRLAHGLQAHAHSVGLHGADWPDHPYCCDFFFVSEDLAGRVCRVEVNQRTDASDHQPILLELALRN